MFAAQARTLPPIPPNMGWGGRSCRWVVGGVGWGATTTHTHSLTHLLPHHEGGEFAVRYGFHGARLVTWLVGVVWQGVKGRDHSGDQCGRQVRGWWSRKSASVCVEGGVRVSRNPFGFSLGFRPWVRATRRTCDAVRGVESIEAAAFYLEPVALQPKRQLVGHSFNRVQFFAGLLVRPRAVPDRVVVVVRRTV